MRALMQDFYIAFSALDAEKMAACYHPSVRFEDPAFGVLEGAHAGNMWRMLCASQQGKDFKINVSQVAMKGDRGLVRWEAFYTFGQTGRKVHNVIQARFYFRDGKIIAHRDRFNLYRWSRQALGAKGALIGWTPFFRKALQAKTNKLLAAYEKQISA